MNDYKPTELTVEDIDNFVKKLMTEEIKKHLCFKCTKEYINSYGHGLGECDECYFARWPKEEREAFFRSFF
jgi:ribosomal protein L37AE/L43A